MELPYLFSLILGLLLLVSAASKLLQFGDFRKELPGFGIPSSYTSLVASLVIVAELLIAAMLAVRSYMKLGASLAILLISVFTIALLVRLSRKEKFSCHCFGSIGHGPTTWLSVVRNIILIAMAVIVLLPLQKSSFGLPHSWTWQNIMLIFLVLGQLITFSLLYGTWRLMAQQNGDSVSQGINPPPVGSKVDLPQAVADNIAESLAPWQGVVNLLFVSDHCTYCSAVLELIRTELPSAMQESFYSIWLDSLETQPSSLLEERDVLTLATSLGVTGTPTLVTLDAENFVTQFLVGEDQIASHLNPE